MRTMEYRLHGRWIIYHHPTWEFLLKELEKITTEDSFARVFLTHILRRLAKHLGEVEIHE